MFTLIDRPVHESSWGASILGWLLVPALIGGVAGHVIAARMQRVKEIATNHLFQQRGPRRREGTKCRASSTAADASKRRLAWSAR
ncbi:DUF6313 family protein [Streptomyces fuscichromogenes]|uniref:DUF6313 family protein n=1 Tax=Streptomyces fuscichromogenes TaxID=1324013 RepID=UPI00382A0046